MIFFLRPSSSLHCWPHVEVASDPFHVENVCNNPQGILCCPRRARILLSQWSIVNSFLLFVCVSCELIEFYIPSISIESTAVKKPTILSTSPAATKLTNNSIKGESEWQVFWEMKFLEVHFKIGFSTTWTILRISRNDDIEPPRYDPIFSQDELVSAILHFPISDPFTVGRFTLYVRNNVLSTCNVNSDSHLKKVQYCCRRHHNLDSQWTNRAHSD